MAASALRERLLAHVQDIRIVDTHEHLVPEADRVAQPADFFTWFAHYASSDLVSAGMSGDDLQFVRDSGKPLLERWQRLAPHWEHAKTTAYGRALIIAARELYDVPEITGATVEALSSRIAEANKPGLYRWVLKEKSGIDLSIIDVGTTDVDREFFAPMVRLDDFIGVTNRGALDGLERRTSVAIHSLDDLLRALDAAFDQAVAGRAVGVKSGLAYSRILQYDKVTRADAERLFVRLFAGLGHGLSWSEAKSLQDFVMHEVVRRCIQYHLPMQIHTGLQEGNANIITNANPAHLTNLFLEYREARFDIFHGGYPYCRELAALAKNFPNVYVDMSWLNVISPAVSRRMLDEWIETVPANKIFAFGGDYLFVEGVYAHQRLARDVVSRVLSAKVEDGYLTEDEAHELAIKLLRTNPAKLYHLDLTADTKVEPNP